MANKNVSLNSNNLKRLLCENTDPTMDHASKNPRTTENSWILKRNIHPELSFHDLPPEMIEKIFYNLRTVDLLNCRQVTHQWKAISSRIMRGRDIPLHFALDGSNYTKHFRHLQCGPCAISLCQSTINPSSFPNKLTDLVACLEESQSFPFTSFRFDGMSMMSFDGLMNFLNIWGQSIRALRVSLSGSTEHVKILLHLLLEKVPNLKTLIFMHLPHVQSLRTLSAALHRQFQLPRLEKLALYDPSEICSEIVEDILTASSKLRIFHNIAFTELSTDLEILYKAQKLRCLKDLTLFITEELCIYWKSSQNRFDLQLQSLTLSFDETIYQNSNLNSNATEIINQLFHSSKNTLQILDTYPLGPLTGLVFPTFKQVKQLRFHRNLNHKDYAMFPLLWPSKFPNVKQLDFQRYNGDHTAIFDDSIKVLPIVSHLRISWSRTSNVLLEAIRRSPNVKTLFIKDDLSFHSDQPQQINFQEISAHLPKLTNLSWQIRFRKPLWYELDALITGFPTSFSRALTRKLRREIRLPEDEIPNYWKPVSPSILDFKELKNLHFQFDKSFEYRDNMEYNNDTAITSTEKPIKSLDRGGFDADSIYYETGFTKDLGLALKKARSSGPAVAYYCVYTIEIE